MTTFLLIIIYIAFIGLGLPDSLFGTAWPAIYGEFALPFSFGSFITIIMTSGTIFSSVMSTRLIARFGTGKVTAVSTALTVIGLIGNAYAGNFLTVCLMAIPLGIGAGAVDTGLNNYVALHYSSVQMNLLHCFFGVGISISPGLMARFIGTQAGWRGGYKFAFLIQLTITLILFLSLPLWNKVSKKEVAEEKTVLSISHRLSTTRDADVIYVLDEGEIVDFGNHEKLLETCEIYKEVYESQLKGNDFDEAE